MFRVLSTCFLLITVSLAGCYSYTAVPLNSAPTHEEVRVRINPARATELQQVLLRDDRVLEGKILAVKGGELLLEVPSVNLAGGRSSGRLNQRVTLTNSDIVEVEVRQMDRLKTAGVAAVILAAGGYLAIQAFDSEGNADPGGGKGGTDNILMPLFRWTW